MAVESVEKNNRQVNVGSKQYLDNEEDIKQEGNGMANKAEAIEFRAKVKKAIEAIEVCYNYETGFHYIKQ